MPRESRKIASKPGKYFLYIPKGIMVVLPEDTIHAGGFCFGSRLITQLAKATILASKTTECIFSAALTKPRQIKNMRRTPF